MHLVRPARRAALTFLLALPLLPLGCTSSGAGGNSSPAGAGGGNGGRGGSGGGAAGSTGGAGGGSNNPSSGGQSGDPAGGQSGNPGGSGGAAAAGTGGNSSGAGGAAGSGSGGAAPGDDAGAPADAPAGPGAGAGCTGAKICDDFEAYAAGGPAGGMWKTHVEGAGTVTVDETRHYSGKRSVLVKTAATGETLLYLEMAMPFLPNASNTVYGRAMIFVPKVPNNAEGHWDLIRASGHLPGKTEEAQYTLGTAHGKFLTDYEPGDCTRYSKQAFPENTWACISWQFDGSKAAGGMQKNEIHVSLDGKPIDDATVVRFGDACTYGGKTTEWVAPPFDTFHIGMNQYHPSPAFEMSIDDLALDDKPIPCPPAPTP